MEKHFKIDKENRSKYPEYSRLLQEILPDREIGKKRTIEEYKKWVIEKNRKLNETAARNDGFKLFMRPYGHKTAKKFYEEIKPFAAFLEMQDFLRDNNLVQLSLKNTNYDVRIFDENSVIFYIEITVTYKDEQENNESDVLNKQGYVVPRVNIKKTRVGGKKRVYELVYDDLKTSPVIAEVNKVKKAIEKKISKNYPDKTLLVIGGVGCKCEDIARIQVVLDSADNSIFTGIFFVDLLNNVFLTKIYH